MSRSFVGSSSSSRSAGSSIRRASTTRACSPPESRPTGVSSCSERNRKRFAQPATWTPRPSNTTESPCGASVRCSETAGSRRCAVLVEHHDLEAVGVHDRARVRRLLAREQAQQRGLAAAVGAEQAEPHPRREHEVEVAHDRALAVAPASGPRRPPAAWSGARSRRSRCPRRPIRERESRSAELVLQPLGLVDAGLGLARARPRLARQPVELAAHAVAQRLLVGGLPGQQLVLLLEEARCSARARRRGPRRRRG